LGFEEFNEGEDVLARGEFFIVKPAVNCGLVDLAAAFDSGDEVHGRRCFSVGFFEEVDEGW
jgi:hypothetical protein